MFDIKWQQKDRKAGDLLNIRILLIYYQLSDNYLWIIYLKERKHQSD